MQFDLFHLNRDSIDKLNTFWSILQSLSLKHIKNRFKLNFGLRVTF